MHDIKVKTVYNPDYQEYVDKLYVDGKYQPDADYFTDDKQDASDTAKAMKRRAEKAYN